MEARPTKIYRISLVVDGNQVLPLHVSQLKALSESSPLLLTPLKSSTYECGLYLKTLSESSLATTPKLFYLSSYNTLYPLDIENIYLISYLIQRKKTPLAFI
ncbi:hypothetical protein BCR42DRAFT_67571 [Absidia repens]|uniref:Uncharacterized protein n=1 Tax=Absidia repens TaxID=90262 RepID=A0A1X2IC02_9FUNG|nr:hypothetical protein BCR42DRAFT_67571 [Absidia repens]